MTLFRPCIDLHRGAVTQLVSGGGLNNEAHVAYVSKRPGSWYARLYRSDGLTGGQLLMLGPGNEEAATGVLREWPGAMKLGGGVTPRNARTWLERGAEQVIVSSFLFENGRISARRLDELRDVVTPSELTVDLSCRRRGDRWVATIRGWRQLTDTPVDAGLLERLAPYCSAFLIHAADVEGLCSGVDRELVAFLGKVSPHRCTYAGGARGLDDLDEVADLSGGRVDLTFGTALDIFGGHRVRYRDLVAYNRARRAVF